MWKFMWLLWWFWKNAGAAPTLRAQLQDRAERFMAILCLRGCLCSALHWWSALLWASPVTSALPGEVQMEVQMSPLGCGLTER